jgi:hypothetical protein
MASEQSYTTNKHNKQKLVNTREGDVIDAIAEVARTLKYAVQRMLLVQHDMSQLVTEEEKSLQN